MKNLLRMVLLTGWICFFATVNAHEIYVSICTIRFLPEEQRVTVRIRMFTDDLDTALKSLSGASPKLDSPNESPASDSLLNAYVQQHFSLKMDGVLCDLQFRNRRYDNDITESNWEIATDSSVRKLNIHNSLLTDIQEAQTNIVRVRFGEERLQFNFDFKITDETMSVE
ncbi:MAG: DUF6702 family protein [Calditrichia bacterium]